jgi:hypothetical protein
MNKGTLLTELSGTAVPDRGSLHLASRGHAADNGAYATRRTNVATSRMVPSQMANFTAKGRERAYSAANVAFLWLRNALISAASIGRPKK